MERRGAPEQPWWGWSVWSALFAAVALSLLVTVRHEPAEEDGLARYGFPFPWTWFGGASLEWDVAPHALLLDVLVVCVALLPPALALGFLARKAPAALRAVAVVLGILAGLAVLVTLALPAALGLTHFAASIPPASAHRSIAVFPFTPH